MVKGKIFTVSVIAHSFARECTRMYAQFLPGKKSSELPFFQKGFGKRATVIRFLLLKE